LKYSELFSEFGYRALDIVLDIDTSDLLETELKKLTSLLIESEKNAMIQEKVAKIKGAPDEMSVKIKCLLSLADSIIP
jgi:hypothetical protein